MNTAARTGNTTRRTDAPIVRQGGIYKIDNGQQTFTDGQGNKYWFVDTTGGPVTVTLLDPSDAAPDTIQTIIRQTGGANALTVATPSGTIIGSATFSIPTQYQAYRFISDGSNYYII